LPQMLIQIAAISASVNAEARSSFKMRTII
jgi:hypothetical protein